MSKMFEYDDIVRVRVGADVAAPARAKAWVVGITEADKRVGAYYDRFPAGNIYTIEFEEGSSIDVHEKT